MGDEELAVGAVEFAEDPVFPVVPVVPELPVVPSSDVLSDEELPLPDVDVDPVDDEVEPDVAPTVRRALAPGWSFATTIPMATVAPVAATITPRVRKRTLDLALSRSAGVLGWAVDIWREPFGWRRPHPNIFEFDADAGPAVVLL